MLGSVPVLPPADLEQMVRPFGRPIYFSQSPRPAQYEPATEDDDDIPTLQWSAQASVQTTTLAAAGLTVDWGNDDGDQDEVVRETHTVRVTNPDDSSQYVDVEVVDSITFKDKRGFQWKQTLHNP